MFASDLAKVNEQRIVGVNLVGEWGTIISAETRTARNLQNDKLTIAPRLDPERPLLIPESDVPAPARKQESPARVLDGRYFEDVCELTWSS